MLRSVQAGGDTAACPLKGQFAAHDLTPCTTVIPGAEGADELPADDNPRLVCIVWAALRNSSHCFFAPQPPLYSLASILQQQ